MSSAAESHLLKADEQRYRISALRREPKEFSHKEFRREVERRQSFQPLQASMACPPTGDGCGEGEEATTPLRAVITRRRRPLY